MTLVSRHYVQINGTYFQVNLFGMAYTFLLMISERLRISYCSTLYRWVTTYESITTLGSSSPYPQLCFLK